MSTTGYGNEGIFMNYAGVESAIGDMEKAYKEINNILDKLEGDLKPLQEKWVGAPKEAYNVAERNWNEAAKGMGLTLDRIKVALRDARDNMQSADKKYAGYFPGQG